MKRLLVCCMLMVVGHHVSAQTPWLWPIEGAKAGDSILYSPQELVDNELNSESLIVAAPEGAAVVAPFDGIFERCGITYLQTLEMRMGWGMFDDSKSIDEKKAEIISSGNFDRSYNPKYLTGSVTLRTADSKSVTIRGLSSDHKFKPGQRIARGTPIGCVAYSYFKIPEPAIRIAVTNGGLKSDPMKPFGLASTYKPYTAPKPVVSLTREQAADDFMIYIDALKECFPGLYDVISPEELDGYVRTTLARINSRKGTIPYTEFRAMMEEAVAKAHDSHIHVYPPEWRVAGGGKSYRPGIWFGFFSDTLRVSNATEQFRHLIGRQIASVNGIGADSIRQIMTSKIATYDAHTEGFKQYMSAIPSGIYAISGNHTPMPDET